MHSVVETAHLDDIAHTIELLTTLVLALKDKEDFHQKL
jgi:putative aminopeptidase FrvX